MNFSGAPTLDRFRAVRNLVATLPSEVAEYRQLAEAEYLAINDEFAAIRRVLEAREALLAGEAVHRSRPALGGQGLARRTGHRTPENFLKHTAGITGQDAVTAVRAGTLLNEIADGGAVDEITGEVLAPSQPWLAPLAPAIAVGTLSTAAAEVIGLGLGSPNSAISVEQLRTAAAVLVAESIAGVDPDELRKHAREARTELDLAGVKLREDELRAQRSLKLFPRPEGGGKLVWILDTETYASVKDLYDRATSPKLHAVRFTSKAQSEIAKRIEDDPRTVEQLASDSVLQLLVQGADADTSFMLGTGAPVIRITVAEADLESGVGVGRIDGQADPVSIETVKRLMDNAITIRMGFDQKNNVLDLEKEQRLFSPRQREALAVKFGGCMSPGCDRPPSWTEAHHILQWKRDGGKTVLENGILFCKHHHLKYHNESWEVICDAQGGYWLIPPVTIDPERTPQPMPLKSHALKDLWRDRTAS